MYIVVVGLNLVLETHHNETIKDREDSNDSNLSEFSKTMTNI